MITGKTPYPDIYYLDKRSDLKSMFDIAKTLMTNKNKPIELSDSLWTFLQKIMITNWKSRPSCTEIYNNRHLYRWLT